MGSALQVRKKAGITEVPDPGDKARNKCSSLQSKFCLQPTSLITDVGHYPSPGQCLAWKLLIVCAAELSGYAESLACAVKSADG